LLKNNHLKLQVFIANKFILHETVTSCYWYYYYRSKCNHV